MLPHGDEFEKHFAAAQFSDQEAANSIAQQGVIVSAACRRGGPPNAFYLALATDKGKRLGPFVISPRTAAEIRKVLLDQRL